MAYTGITYHPPKISAHNIHRKRFSEIMQSDHAEDEFCHTPKFPMRYEFKHGGMRVQYGNEPKMEIGDNFITIQMDILKYGPTGVHKMRKIKISQKVKNGDGEVIDIKDEKEYRNKTLVVATHEYMTEFKLENTDDLLFREEVELWREFEA